MPTSSRSTRRSNPSVAKLGRIIIDELLYLKVDDAKVDQIVKMAPEDPTAGGNPVKLDRRAARTIFMRALEGRV